LLSGKERVEGLVAKIEMIEAVAGVELSVFADEPEGGFCKILNRRLDLPFRL
tara:strand:- start:894 stop:1049 length:156 start_codon:yes stop_codon:yes gene_type:complete